MNISATVDSFTIFTVNDNKDITDKSRFTPPPACGCKSNLISTLVEMGVSVLVAGGMGPGCGHIPLGQRDQGHPWCRRPGARRRPRLAGRKKLQDNDEVCHVHGDEGCQNH